MNKIKIVIASALLALSSQIAGAQGLESSQRLHQGFQALKEIPNSDSARPKTVKVLKSATRKTLSESSPFYGRTFYGSLINNSEWANATITTVPYGIYSFELNDNIEPQPKITDMVYNFVSGAYTGDEFFGIYPMTVLGAMNGARYITVDTENWKESKQVMYDTSYGSYSLISATMAYNYIDDTVYSLQYNDDLSGLNWCKLNPTFYQMDKLATFRGKYNVLTMAATPDGEMYFINSYGDLYKINRKTGRPSLVAWTGVTPILYSQSMMYDNRTGLFLWAALTSDGSELYSVDPATAEATLLTKFKNQEQFTAIYSTDNEAKDGAPAMAKNLKLSYESEGGLNGALSFDLPTTTFDGNALGSSMLNVWIDGEKIKSETVSAGQKFSFPVELTEGNHYVAVNMKNEQGWSPLASLKQYAGYDIPCAVENVNFTHEDGKNTISWTAPAEGVNKGYIDKANLKYTIVRIPDNVTVAENLTSTTFTEPEPETLHNYSYRVYAVNRGKVGAYTESNKIACGGAFSVPYSQGFDGQSTFEDYFTVVDNNNDGNTWKFQESGNMVRFDLSVDQGDDWLITPAIDLKGGTNYKLTINLKTYMKGKPEDFDIMLGTDLKDLSTFKTVKKEEGLEMYEKFSDYTMTFNTEESGRYYIALRYLTKRANNGGMLLVKKFSVDEMGNAKAPAAGTNMSVKAGADDAMEATISFTTPNKDLTGEDINSLTKVNVYRNGDENPVHTFESPAVNSVLTWTDKKVKKTGLNAYTVKAVNEYGEGAALADSAFVGCYTAPYLETFDTKGGAEQYTTYISGVDLEANPGSKWGYSGSNMSIFCFKTLADVTTSAWLITPYIKLDDNSVYTFSYKKNFSAYTNTLKGNLYMGKEPIVEAQNMLLGEIKPNVTYDMEESSSRVVTTEGGKYCFGFDIEATAQWDLIQASIDDVSLTYEKSAFSPLAITDFKISADQTGALKSNMSFKAPDVDYHGDRLKDNLTISIYRGNGSIPVYTVSNVVPGSEIKWTDDQAIKGQNTYTVIASNKYGKSDVFTSSLYVGNDRPSTVENLAVKGTADNMGAVISWSAPSKGHHGGVVQKDELTYRVLQYDPTEKTLTIVADDVKDNTYSVDCSTKKKQEILYYGVVAKSSEGIGDTLVTNCAIGKLYEVPFKESFSNTEVSTSTWVISSEASYLNWGVDAPSGNGYNGATPQDEDGGCAYFYNGSYYETYAGAGFISPKVAIHGQDNKLSFWVYNYAAKYENNLPYVLVYARIDDGPYTEVGRYQVAEVDGEEGWKNYTIDLSAYKNNNFINFGFYAYTAGYQECIYLDNISVESASSTGISDISAEDKAIQRVNYYDLSGKSVIVPGKGVFVKTVTYTDGSKKSVKVVK